MHPNSLTARIPGVYQTAHPLVRFQRLTLQLDTVVDWRQSNPPALRQRPSDPFAFSTRNEIKIVETGDCVQGELKRT